MGIRLPSCGRSIAVVSCVHFCGGPAKGDPEEALAIKVKTEDEVALQQDTEDEDGGDDDEGKRSNKRQKEELDAFLNADIDKIVSMGRHDKDALKDLEQFSKRLQRSLEEVRRKRQDDEERKKERIEKEKKKQIQRLDREKKRKARQKLLDEDRCMLCKEKASYTMPCVEFQHSKVHGNGVMICEGCYDKAVPKEFQKNCEACWGFLHRDFVGGLCSADAGCDIDYMNECDKCGTVFCEFCAEYFDFETCGICDKLFCFDKDRAVFEKGLWFCEDCA